MPFRRVPDRCQPPGGLRRSGSIRAFPNFPLDLARTRRLNPTEHRRRHREPGRDDHGNDSEAAHALVFVIVCAIAGGAVALGWLDTALWLTAFNVLFNGYPVMLQRYNRLRLEPLLGKRGNQ